MTLLLANVRRKVADQEAISGVERAGFVHVNDRESICVT
jgi:hypothetical protein